MPRSRHQPPDPHAIAPPSVHALGDGRIRDELNLALPGALDDEQWALLYEAAETCLGARPEDAEALAIAIRDHLEARYAQGEPGPHLQALVDAMPHWTVAHWVAVTDATRRFWGRVDHDGLATDPRRWARGRTTAGNNGEA